MTPVVAVGISNVLLVYVLLLPFLDRSKRTHPRDRPLFIWLATSLLAFFVMMTVWGGETPGVQITPPSVAITLGPIFLVNGLVVALFHWRYHRSYQRRLAARMLPYAGPFPAAPAPAPAAGAAPAAEVAPRE